MAEQIIFEQGGTKVTSARVVIGPQTYALGGITSVQAREIPPSRKGPIILMIVGFPFFFIGTIIGIIWLIRQKTTYAVLLVSAAGEQEALTSKDKALIAQIVNAINEAIIARG
ncbi:MAG: hypothetical protein HY763_14795 [Planctomycetes bacterium]|nr:hypothetical protein [Planctomycetota bacterium]